MADSENLRIIIDVMGGDNAPLEILKGVCEASRECNAKFVLVGNENEILRIAEEQGLSVNGFEIIHTSSVIEMDDDPILSVRKKKDSSMVVGLRMLAESKGDAFVSAGNTGALFTGASVFIRRVNGIGRAAIGTVLPATEPCLLLDSGANVTVTEEQLEQFAVMGSAYMQKMYDMENPKVGLLNIGTEECKGAPLHIETNHRLNSCKSINYVGNVEGSAVPFGACNVLVTDGFTGNVFLKTIEGTCGFVLKAIKKVFMKNCVTKFSALLVKNSFNDMKREFDPAEHGGAPILGLAKPVVKAHGSSNARAFKNAIFKTIKYTQSNIINDIEEATERYCQLHNEQ